MKPLLSDRAILGISGSVWSIEMLLFSRQSSLTWSIATMSVLEVHCNHPHVHVHVRTTTVILFTVKFCYLLWENWMDMDKFFSL